MRNVIRALLGKPVQLSPKQEEKMARMQARADAMIAEQNAKLPPGTQVPGGLGEIFKQSFEQARTELGGTFDDRRGILDPGPGTDLNRPPAEVEDATQREAIRRGERSARLSTRQPFLPPAPPEIAFTRFATTGREQLHDVVAALQSSGLAAHPERVYGVYRVPDRCGGERGNEAKAYVEWEIAHRPGALNATADPVLTTAFRRDAHIVHRNPGDPSVLDEDVAGVLAGVAHLQPKDCFGLTRLLQLRGMDFGDNTTSLGAHIEGVLLFTRDDPAVTQAQHRIFTQAPLSLLPESPYHLEILDWEAIAAWVAPYRHGEPRTPSPLPHLPSDWQELLTAYLQIVGVRSEDCYGVQVTRGKEGVLADLSFASFRKNMGSKPKLPCVDGEPRTRTLAAEQVIIAYRDRTEYREGRSRWQAYQREALHARLDHLTGVRPAIVADDHPRPSFLSEVFDMFNPLDPLQAFPQVFNRNERPSLGPYCGTLP